ncbi:tRNA pseudouridine(38-40) synthase TruA [Flavobacterium jejuense]|uniref:tRNA pseudouridine synthase A n=1 Tax=Flavobacterium jejuense TaxID=1544455 RepID=A0ABX0ILA0_9FLAO|nr:tRNA pseudouridine(38-40) synthase TruA [Flavobacterium jejuense]NHN24366.1 tRNA pseudouridine(38-40) synthase TruA [Flavobacterium jejuense]
MRYFIKFAYNGKNYFGFQIQPNAISIQETLDKALSLLLKQKIEIVGAGRTDSGVHAKEMFAHFEYDGEIDAKYWTKKLNSYLPNDIVIFDFIKVNNDAHARFDATSRTYEYYIHTFKDVFNQEGSWYFFKDLDINQMNKACELLFKHIDFECFSKVNTDVHTFNCKITKAYWVQKENQLIFTIKADRFLRNMVRAIVGTMINIGLGKISIDDFEKIIKSKNRSKAGFSVPAHGLYLVKVDYPYIN